MISLDVKTKNGLINLSKRNFEEISRVEGETINKLGAILAGGVVEEPVGDVSFLITLVKEAIRVDASVENLEECIKSIGKSLELNLLIQWYNLNRDSVRQLLINQQLDNSAIPRYSDIEWRLESTVETRNGVPETNFNVLVKLRLKDNVNGDHFKLLNLDLANFNHVKEVLEDALNESRSLKVQKLIRQKRL